ncbi:50S ribosomal protein L4 [Candidatus Parcubacteria bacterium]|nr:50S ribosomal protein L4 [Candidatus Parcubacteria bacterium]
MLVDTYNQSGEKTKQTQLPAEIFEVKMNTDLVHQVAVSQSSNRRHVLAHTKDRSDVRGGGRKPWRQKGTGRARVGSRRSPIWKGGGVTFGPTKERNFKKDIPRKMRRKALFMVLSSKVESNTLILLDELKAEKGKTKQMAELLNKLPCKDQSSLLSLVEIDKKTILAARNIPKTQTIQTKELNVLDLLNHKYLVMSKEAAKVIQETFSAKNEEVVEKKTAVEQKGK